jgi:spore coat protein U-like protein
MPMMRACQASLAEVEKVKKNSSFPGRITLLSIAAMALAPLHAAAATTASRSFNVSVMVVLPECLVSAVPARLSASGGATPAPVVSVDCVTPIPYSIGLSEGLAAEVTVANRRGSTVLAYSLKSSTGETARWGQKIGIALSEPATHTFSVVGPIPAKEEVADDRDAGTVTVTITY